MRHFPRLRVLIIALLLGLTFCLSFFIFTPKAEARIGPLTITPSTVSGSCISFTASGTHWIAGDRVRFTEGTTKRFLGYATVQSDGTFSLYVASTCGVPKGRNFVNVRDINNSHYVAAGFFTDD